MSLLEASSPAVVASVTHVSVILSNGKSLRFGVLHWVQALLVSGAKSLGDELSHHTSITIIIIKMIIHNQYLLQACILQARGWALS